MRIDLDALVGTNEAEENTLVFKGEEFTLPAQMPAEFLYRISLFAKESADPVEAVRAGASVALIDALAACFGAEQWRQIMALRPSQDHLIALVNEVPKLYTPDATLGESRGSRGKSPSLEELQKLTSNGSTELTSAEPQGKRA